MPRMYRLVTTMWLVSLAIACNSALAKDGDSRVRARVDFKRHVMPLLSRLRCNSCHAREESPGGLRLSVLAGDPAADYAALAKDHGGRRVSPVEPATSLLITRPLGYRGCQGLKVDSAAYHILLRWIAEGASDASPDGAPATRISIEPPDDPLRPGDITKLRVFAEWANGDRDDVTLWTVFGGGKEDVATVTADGRLDIVGGGFTTITARYAYRGAAVPLTIAIGEAEVKIDSPVNNFIDERIIAGWRRARVTPAASTKDAPFCRRAYQHLIGRQPTPRELVQFLRDDRPSNRTALIDSLLQRKEYARHWAHVWTEWLLMESKVSDESYLALVQWLTGSFESGLTLDDTARRLLTARGKLADNGATAFYSAHPTEEKLAGATESVFLGSSSACARCHPHPRAAWKPSDFTAISSQFAGVLSAPSKEEGAEIDVRGSRVQRHALATEITRTRKREFARNMVNRYWAELFGRGLVEPVNDLSSTNLPTHPQLLNQLTDEFLSHNMDTKYLLRLICNSHTYQLSSELSPAQANEEWFYSRFYPRRLRPWALHHSIRQAVGLKREPPEVSLAVWRESQHLFLSGRPRTSSCPRNPPPTISQALHLINSNRIGELLANPNGIIARSLAAGKSNARIVDDFYLRTLTDLPDQSAKKQIEAHFKKTPRRTALEDVLWALMNTKEFLFIH